MDTLGPGGVSCIERVSSFQEYIYIKKGYLGHSKVSLIERCPYFRGVLKEGFHCIRLLLEQCG